MKKFKLKSCRVFMSLAFAGFILGIFSFSLESSMGLEFIGIAQNDNCFVALSDHDTMCKNAFAEHLNFWQSIFTALPQEKSIIGFLMSVLVLSVTFLFRKQHLFLLGIFAGQQRRYAKQHPSSPLFDFLRTLFSQGILNPKAYILSVA